MAHTFPDSTGGGESVHGRVKAAIIGALVDSGINVEVFDPDAVKQPSATVTDAEGRTTSFRLRPDGDGTYSAVEWFVE